MRRPDAHHSTHIVVLPWARQELRRAYLWYRRDNPRAAADFQAAFQEALVVIVEAPLRWAEVEPGVRRYLLPRHPYVLRYSVEAARVEILSVTHHARHPDAWRDRR